MDVKQKVLLIVPHQDDELLVGGGLFKTLAQHGTYEAYVVFTTNGDYFPEEGEVRLRESLYVLSKLYGIPEAHIFFLGYGDGWQGDVHLYHHQGDEPLCSMAGRTQTYGIEGHEDYRWKKTGSHSAYCRKDFKQDIKDVLWEIKADIVLAVDYDKHPDHKAASLLTEECLGELFRENAEYRPLVLKRFAYDGVWKGKADFFELPRKGTVLTQTAHSPYHEEEALRFAMPADCATHRLSRNFLYRVLRCYKTQEAWQKADEIINMDEVFFRRHTDSFLYDAQISATSGRPAGLNDFMLFDCENVLQGEMRLGECGWKPDGSDQERRVKIAFSSPKTVGRIAVYARGNGETDHLQIGFSFDNGTVVSGITIRPDGKKNLVDFAPQTGVRHMEMYIEKWEGISGGITELEVLPPEEEPLPEILTELLFQGDTVKVTGLVKVGMKIEKGALAFRRKLSHWLPNIYVLRRHYPELAGKDMALTAYRVRHITARLQNRRQAQNRISAYE